MRHLSFLALSLLTFMCFAITDINAAEAPPVKAHPHLLNKNSMQSLTKAAEPSDQNRILSTLLGPWDFDLKYWSKTEGEPELSTGVVTNEMILNGRFLSSEINVMLNVGGQNLPYQGLQLIGYDSSRNLYTANLADTMHSGMTAGAGKYDEKSKKLELEGEFNHPLMSKSQKYRAVIEFKGSEEYQESVFISNAAGKEYKVLEIDFRRKR